MRRPAARQEMLTKARLILQDIDLRLPFSLDDRGHRIAALGVLDRGAEQLFEGQLAELVVQRPPGGHAARHRHRVPAALRNGAVADSLEVSGVPRRRRPSGGVQAVQLSIGPDDGETVRTEAVGHRLDQGDDRCGRDCRVDGSAALAQRGEAGLRGQGLRRRYDVAGKDGGPDRGITVVPAERQGCAVGAVSEGAHRLSVSCAARSWMSLAW